LPANEKFGAIRKGLLEFLILKIISADRVYVADILQRLASQLVPTRPA
jgi:PadR family transcriptional regulator PadR